MPKQAYIHITNILFFVLLGVVVGLLFPKNPVHYLMVVIGFTVIYMSLLNRKHGIFFLVVLLPFIYFFKRLEIYTQCDFSREFNNPISLLPEIILMFLLLSTVFTMVIYYKENLYKIDPLTYIVLSFLILTIIQIFNPKISTSIGLYGFRTFGYYILAYFVGRYLFDLKLKDIRFFFIQLES